MVKRRIIAKKKYVEEALGVELPVEVVGMETAPEGGALWVRESKKEKCKNGKKE